MERRAERARVAAARPGRTALEEENRRLRGAVKLLEGRNASRYASEMYALVFDRDGQLPQVRIAQLEATVVRKNAEIEKLRGFLAAYSALVPFQPARGSIIEGSAS